MVNRPTSKKQIPYSPAKIEKKWQKFWETKKLYEATTGSKKPKWYSLIEFPYPSGDGLHVGHIRSNTAMDIISRKRRREGYEVLYPIGWDAFGLPTENFAIKTGIHPVKVTKKNTDTFRKQLKALGFSFDWSREINTSDPAYYKWTQWIFIQLYNKGLAYKKNITVNWCPKDKTGLANEEVIDGKCERCGTPVEKRQKEQWMLAITKYADRLIDDLDTVNYLPEIKAQQINWIGRSEGAEFDFAISGSNVGIDTKVTVFTTRPDTLFGVTYIVLAPESEYVQSLKPFITNWQQVEEYIAAARIKTDIDRTDIKKEKTGVVLEGIFATHPATGEKVPVWIADYVLADYGTGAVMAVPAHDERDFVFATKYNLPIKEVIIPRMVDTHDPPQADKKTVDRRAVQAIVIDPKTKKVLCLKWKKFPWTTFITGGVEGNEDLVEAAKREIIEETGYTDLTFIKKLGGNVESHFYAAHKGENRKALFTAMVFELASDARTEMSDEENAIHEVAWLTWEELAKDTNIKCSEYELWLDRFFNPPHAYTEFGVLQDSGDFTGMQSHEVLKPIAKKYGRTKISYKLRDWVFSRQRYWGEPIPMVHCESCGWQPIPEKELPLKLPEVKKFQPTDKGESPLATAKEWVKATCPKCKGKATRETDTMPNWAGSSWYAIRYADPENKKSLADAAAQKYWLPVDWYNGGMEHTTLHLLYSRFWHKFLFDIGATPTTEPYQKRTAHGLILAEDGRKMSKSWGNVINPDTVIKQVGADTVRLYEMFMAPFDQAVAWNTTSIAGSRRFIERVWNLQYKLDPKPKVELTSAQKVLLNQTIKKVGDDIEAMRFNTAVSALMIYTNSLDERETVSKHEYEILLQLLAPFTPHVVEELWERLGYKVSIHMSLWPHFDEQFLESDTVTYAVQVNGKMRGTFEIERSADQNTVVSKARSIDSVKKHLEGAAEKKVIFIAGKMVNFVVG